MILRHSGDTEPYRNSLLVVRVYIEPYEPDAAKQDKDTQEAIAPLMALADELAAVKNRTGRDAPSVVT